jgi:hypothetical protein
MRRGRRIDSPVRVATLTAAVLTCLACSDTDGSSDTGDDISTVTVNELSGSGSAEWLELYNAGDGGVDLGLYGVTDTDEDTGLPRVDNAMRFPEDTRLAAGGFLLVLLGKDNSVPGPYTQEACLPGVAADCFYADFAISEARGEAVHLLTPEGDPVLDVRYPADLVFPADSELTACRLPDGTGELTTCSATPDAPNAAP